MQRFEKTFKGVGTSLAETRQFLAVVLSEIEWSDREIDLQLAIGEVTQNIIRYGFQGGDEDGQMSLTFEFDDDHLTCLITDNAPPVDVSTWTSKAEQRRPDEGGYGLSIINAIADEFEVMPQSDGNVARLTFSSSAKA